MSNSRNASTARIASDPTQDSSNNSTPPSIHSGSDEQPYNNFDSPDSHKYSRIDAIRECSLPIPIPKPPLPQKLGTRRLQINPSYFKAVPDPKEYKYYFAPDLKSKQ